MGEELPAWGSTLTCQELAAIGSAGFAPVGQAFGAAVYAAESAGGSFCPGVQVSADGTLPAPPAAQMPGPGPGDPRSFRPLVEAMYQARQAAIERMTAECAALGGHGVVGVRLTRAPYPLGGLAFTAIGTAVRAAGVATTAGAPGAASSPQVPFASDLSGQDFAKLLTAGWVPAGLALGIAIGARHDDRATRRQARLWAGNAEMAGWTAVVNQARHDARRGLEEHVRRLGAEGVVTADMRMQVRVRDCPVATGRSDHVVEVTFVGTAIARFSHDGHHPAWPVLPVMPLGR